MLIKYKKTVLEILVLYTVFLWCYIVLRPADPLWKDSNFHSSRLHSIPLTDVPIEANNTKLIVTMQAKENTEAVRVTNGDCIGMELPVHLLQEESWSAIDEAGHAFVFSAYNVEQGGTIKAVGASIRSWVKIFCQYWHLMHDNQTVQLLEKPAAVRLISENHDNKYTGTVFECPASTIVASYVSLVTRHCSLPLNLLMIKNGIKPQNYPRQFTVCLKPLHFRYGRAYELVEWIEFNKVLGAEKIVIYNYSIAINTAQVLDHYVKQGFVEVVQWNLPIKSYTRPKTKDPVEIHSMGMLPMLQDCFLRNKAHSDFVVNVDVDEFIIPHFKNATWSEMIAQMPSTTDTYLFRNTFFRKEWDNSQIVFPKQYLAKELRIITLQKFEREDRIFTARSKSKYFTKTTKDKTLMIHDVTGGSSYVVPIEIGLLHHYRYWRNHEDASKRVVDDTVLRKYGQSLIKRIQNTWKELGSIKRDIPI